MNYDICVFGGCALDQIFYADENGNYPERPDVLVPGGKAANQAVAASRAGASVTIITRLGKDEVGNDILDNLIYNGVHTNNVEMIDGLNNDVAFVYINEQNKDNEIKRVTGAIDSFTPDMIEKYKDVFLHSKMVIAQMKAPKEVSTALIDFCHKHNIPIIITPCRPKKLIISENGNKELIDKISFITCNKMECQTIFETEDIEKCVKAYPNKLIVTLGKDGLIYNNGRETIHMPAPNLDKVEDTTGAGDTFNGNLAAFLVSGDSLYEAIYKAQFASSIKIQSRTAQEGMPYKEELENYISNYQFGKDKYQEEFNVAYKVMKEAAKVIRKKKTFKVQTKEDNTFVTDSDKMVEKTIIDKIRSKFPNDTFVTEEYNPNNKVKGRTWVLDPIDGTVHYMKNSIYWGIQLAFVDDEVRFSMIYIPKLKEFYYAIKGKGAYLNNVKIQKSDCYLHESIVEFCGSLYKNLDSKKDLFYTLIDNSPKPANFMHINSCSYGFANLFSKRTNALVLSTKRVWDVLPGNFIALEAGINQYIYKDLIIYSNSKEFDDLIKEKN